MVSLIFIVAEANKIVVNLKFDQRHKWSIKNHHIERANWSNWNRNTEGAKKVIQKCTEIFLVLYRNNFTY